MSTKTKEDIISIVEQQYPGTCAEFKRIQDEHYATFCKKQFDYGPGNISLGSSLSTPEEKKASISAIVVRLNDKMQRLINLVLKKNTLEGSANEPVFDAFLDISVYGIIAEIVKRGLWAK
jgi:hypothetical protein